MKICVPVKEDKGLESLPFNHFGSAPMFLVVDSETKNTVTLNNGDLNHEHGKCQPIKAIGSTDVDAVIVGGIGAGAINKLNQMGIKVYRATSNNVSKNVDLLVSGNLCEFNPNNSCNHHDCGHHDHK